MPRAAALAAGVVGAVLVTALLTVPFLQKERRLPAVIIQPSPLFATALIPLKPDTTACIRGAAIDSHSEVALFQVGTRQKPGVPLEFTVSGEGYRQRVRRSGDYEDNEIVSVQIRPPERPTSVSICLRNRGDRRVDLYGTGDTSAAPVVADVDGARVQNFNMSFFEADDATLLQRKRATAERTARFRPVGPNVVLLLALLVVVAVPAALVAAMALAARDRERP